MARQYTIYIAWGECDSHRAQCEEYDKLQTEPRKYEFETEEEFRAFLHGVSEAIQWLEYYLLTEDEYRKALEALSVKKNQDPWKFPSNPAGSLPP